MRTSIFVAVILLTACSGPTGNNDAGTGGGSGGGSGGGGSGAGPAIVTIAAAGDISAPSLGDQKKTSDLIVDAGFDAVFVLGDNQYPAGAIADYNTYFEPTWGRVKSIIYPAPGNHEYLLGTTAPGYYSYFGARAGDSAKGYYSFDLGQWHIISLNSNDGSCIAVPCAATSPQITWLKADLAANKRKCTLAFWHHPRFDSGATHGNNTDMQAFWDALYAGDADVILNGHEHIYERFDPQAPTAAADATRGIREFIVGTGGIGFYSFTTPQPNSVVRGANTYGVLKLTLKPDSYDWEFLGVSPVSFTDSGSGTCH